ncbi:hypothetical protein MTR67_007150 [Solanum verrucosum]|uniref:Retrotransposon gag domain-containing protein n=1 Tax=Solanum verrucosum TaxID=315347 RepID=A0AAF0THW7_SOLVR|nr:hypothetical protein MTR67_007150 [Solanum verrucosum]
MPPHRPYARNANAHNANAVPQVPNHRVLNVVFQNIIQLLAKSIENKNNQRVLVPTNTSGYSVAARVRDFVRMNPPEFVVSQVGKDPHNFINEWKENRGKNASLVTYECFTITFLDMFFPRELREAKDKEFMNLRQGSISVQEYGPKFTQHSRHALHMVADPMAQMKVQVEILDHQVRRLRKKEVASVKVFWRSQSVEGATWEAEAALKAKYPHLFPSDSIPT